MARGAGETFTCWEEFYNSSKNAHLASWFLKEIFGRYIVVTKVRVRLAAFMGCNLGKGSQPDDSDLREDGKRLASGPTSPTTPPPGIVSDRMVDGHVPNKDTNALQQRLESTIEEQGFESVPLTENDFQKEAQEAATKIQATFRSYKVRKEVRLGSSAAGSDTNLTDDTDNQRTEMKEADDAACADIDLSDPGLNQAASKIQATFRGHQVRKSPLHQPRVQELGQNQNEEQNQQEKDFGEEDLPDDIKDMDLNDPDLAKAAVKIQATFRGYKTRSKVE